MHFLQLPTPDPDVIAAADSAKANFAERIGALTRMPVQDALAAIAKDLIAVGWKILLVLVVYFVGRWLIKRLLKAMNRILDRRGVDVSLHSFLSSLVKATLYVTLTFIIIGILGINTTSFIALFASAGLAIGMALSGTLQNFAGGVMILMVRPFRVGDFIEAQGQSGAVNAIRLTYTTLNTSDNKTIYLPNGPLSTGIINNYSHEEERRVEWTFGIGYGDDYDRAHKIIRELLESDGRINKDKQRLVALSSLAESSVNIVVRAWTLQGDYWDVFFDLNEKVFKAFSGEGINIPYPQLDVHLYQDSRGSGDDRGLTK